MGFGTFFLAEDAKAQRVLWFFGWRLCEAESWSNPSFTPWINGFWDLCSRKECKAAEGLMGSMGFWVLRVLVWIFAWRLCEAGSWSNPSFTLWLLGLKGDVVKLFAITGGGRLGQEGWWLFALVEDVKARRVFMVGGYEDLGYVSVSSVEGWSYCSRKERQAAEGFRGSSYMGLESNPHRGIHGWLA